MEDKTWYGRSIIQTCVKLAYGQAQLMIEGKPVPDVSDASLVGPHSVAQLTQDVRTLDSLAKQRRGRRFAGGSLKLDSVKLCFARDESGNPNGFFTYEIKDSSRPGLRTTRDARWE